MSQLPADCLNEIFEYLEDDKLTLYSCILVNRLWCEVSVRIFWRDASNYSISNFNTLISCLPNKSKEILYENGIVVSTKTPIFNYASFCKVLSINQVYYKIERILKNQQSTSLQNLDKNVHIVEQEMLKMFMNQISSLKSLIFYHKLNYMPIFTSYPGSNDCLKNLSKLSCCSNISSELYYQLSQNCHNILSLDINIITNISDGLSELISVQKNLKYLNIEQLIQRNELSSLVTKVPNTLIKLKLCEYNFISLSFIAKFVNLQELEFSIKYIYEGFDKLQDVIFPQLQVLKFTMFIPKVKLLIKFLEKNGKNLKEFYIKFCLNHSLNLAVAKFCTNLRKLGSLRIIKLEKLKTIFNNCQYLESIKFFCGSKYINEKEILETVVKDSQNVIELILHYVSRVRTELLPEELESIFISWTNRIPQKSLSLVIVKHDKVDNSLDTNDENMEIIKKYIKLGVLKFKK
ncbi:hypothetical protein RclHR1_01140021 [Rhizophagus clarus]|uniref:Uncharacterized protein n=1 Tax=Rhizophagus clarus TaxID=94130 RepID=A0A2Z6Q8N5_9GLOM|nr:hypothetical protein RclHR1_01140021 [Rhizophagus clarus]GES97895.1 hypothetical protein GLOIN_2v1876445 [Rhizophagus clarus]